MDRQRRQRIDEVLEQALTLAPEQRAAFLAQVSEDAELRWEVEALLALEAAAEGFIETPLLRALSERQIGRYVIKERIGRGGMGEVWRAEDTLLNRNAAIKMLPPEFAADPERVRRFEQEALAASRLNHPNIITIYEVIRTADLHLIITEHIDGQTLRARLIGKRLTIAAALDIAVQIASALAAAHEAGVVHRDIKPENVMLRRDGIIKVLDFGIAKLGVVEWESARGGEQETDEYRKGSSVPPPSPSLTLTGGLLGTVSYMSPEQARGARVDARTDIFSLGVVLYEMVAGCKPFVGADSAAIIAAILESEPPLAQLPMDTPERLRGIISRALQKERAERYQTAAEMLEELKAVARELELQTVSPPPAPLSSPKRRYALITRLALAALFIALLGVIVWRWRPAPDQHQALAGAVQVTQLTYSGNVSNAAISRDGKQIVYVAHEAGRQSLQLRAVDSSDIRPLIAPIAKDELYGPTFTPDAQEVFYLRYEEDRDMKSLYRVASAGGEPRKVLDHVDNTVAFAPDGRRFAFIRHAPQAKESYLLVANRDGSGERVLLARPEPVKFSFGWHWPTYSWNGRVAWSPDGKMIAFATGTVSTAPDHQLFVIPADGGAARLLTNQKWWRIWGLDWVNQGDELLVLAADRQLAPYRIWRLDLSTGLARQLVHDPNSYWGLSATADGKIIVSVLGDQQMTIWKASTTDLSDYRPLPSGKTDGQLGLRWTADNKLLFDSNANGTREMWLMEADGSQRQRLTPSAADGQADLSLDGRWLVYSVRTQGETVPHIWRLDRQTGARQQLTNGGGEYEAQFTPDGRWVVYVTKDGGAQAAVWKVPATGGAAVRLTAEQTENPSPAISPDGKLLAYYKGLGLQHKRIEVLTWDRLQLKQSFAVKRTAYLLRWRPDGRALTFANTENEVTNLWQQPLKGGPPQQITFFKTDEIGQFDWSRDGRYLICSRTIQQRDAFLIKDGR